MNPVIYSVGDLHGYLDTFLEMLKNIKEYHEQAHEDRPAHLVLLGDYVDRGPKSRQILDLLIADSHDLLTWFAERVYLKGNHEDMMAEACLDPGSISVRHWIDNGGNTTVMSYIESDDDSRVVIPRSHIDWIQARPLYHQYGPWLFVHAGIDPRVRDIENIGSQLPNTLMWVRNVFLDCNETYPWRVVHGHTPVVFEGVGRDRSTPVFKPNRINVDTSAYITERLTAVVLDEDNPVDEPMFIQVSSESEGGSDWYHDTQYELSPHFDVGDA